MGSLDLHTRPQCMYTLLIKLWETRMDSLKKDWEYTLYIMILTNGRFEFISSLKLEMTFKVET